MSSMNRITIVIFALTGIAVHAQKKLPSVSPYENDFQSAEPGLLPEGIMEIDGVFKVTKGEGDKQFLVMENEPLSENAVILGPSLKGAASVSAKIRSFRKRRSYPRFAVGLHGISGFRLRVVPSKGVVELVKNEESVKAIPYKWKHDEWTVLQLDIAPDGEDWRVDGRVWHVRKGLRSRRLRLSTKVHRVRERPPFGEPLIQGMRFSLMMSESVLSPWVHEPIKIHYDWWVSGSGKNHVNTSVCKASGTRGTSRGVDYK